MFLRVNWSKFKRKCDRRVWRSRQSTPKGQAQIAKLRYERLRVLYNQGAIPYSTLLEAQQEYQSLQNR
ncbi:hypothetical protein NIES2104_12350 [Leptolyngbya sp. NIES-2104]|nr:hypothetical protein NIES2104_12350 [Leptolyngbya sp. NIES-2104]